MLELSSEWSNEAYVSLHLVQEMLRMAGLPPRSSYSHWHPEFKIKVPKLTANGSVRETNKEVDFLVEDLGRYINFLVEVKAADTPIDDDARIQLQTYLKYSNTRFGLLIDPFSVEIYEYTQWQFNQMCTHTIQNPKKIEPVADFIKSFLETIKLIVPFVCITDEEDKYHLLTGLPIYEAAVLAGVDRIWVFLIAAKKPEAEKFIEQALLQSKLNDRVIDPQDVTEFLEFINNKKADLTQINGIGEKYAKLISGKRPYASQEDMQNKLGAKRSLNWLKAYKASDKLKATK